MLLQLQHWKQVERFCTSINAVWTTKKLLLAFLMQLLQSGTLCMTTCRWAEPRNGNSSAAHSSAAQGTLSWRRQREPHPDLAGVSQVLAAQSGSMVPAAWVHEVLQHLRRVHHMLYRPTGHSCCSACRELGLRRSIAVEVKAIHSDAGRQLLVSLMR
jgi:hypothetical protein